MTNALVPMEGGDAPASGWTDPPPLPGSPGGASALDREYAAALDLMHLDPRRYASPEHQAKLIALVEGRQEAPARAVLTNLRSEVADWNGFATGFDALPASAMAAIEQELTNPIPASRAIVSAAAVEQFGKDDAGRICVREWGEDAPQKVARFQERATMLQARLRHDPDAWDAVLEWFDGLPPSDAAAVVRMLAK